MQADAKAKRSGIAPAQIVGETEQAWSCGHDEGAYCCIEPDEETERTRRKLMLDNQQRQAAQNLLARIGEPVANLELLRKCSQSSERSWRARRDSNS